MHWLIMVSLVAQLDAPKPAEAVRTPAVVKVPDAYDAAVWALEDATALKLRQQSAKHCLYVWIGPENDPNIAKINSLAVNSALSHASVIVLPELTAGGRLLRWDLSQLCPDPRDFHRLVGIVNSLAKGEPYWHFDRAALGLNAVQCAPYLWIDGKQYHQTFYDLHPATADAYRQLQIETGLHTPLVRADYLLRKISSTIQGGLYYHARGFIVHEHGKPRRLNLKEIFAVFGNDVDLSRRVKGDDRVGIVISGVTGQARAVEYGQGAIGGWRITYDRFSDNERIDAHPFYSLIKVVERADGLEVIFEMPNGLLCYVLFNGKGELVDEAPNKLVTDHRTPIPHPAQLFPPLSCVRCHGPSGGVQRTPNDVPKLLKDSATLDAFADFGGTGITSVDVDRIAGLYGGDFEERAMDARNKYANAQFKATRGLRAEVSAAEWARQYEAGWQVPVNATAQLLDLGWKARSPQAANHALEILLQKREDDLLVFGQKASLEDPLRPAPRLGIPIRRQDAERIQPESWRRAFQKRDEILSLAP